MTETIKTYTGDVIRKRFGRGTKSERDAIYLSTQHGDILLRRQASRALPDEVLEGLVGKRIRAKGYRLRHTFEIVEWTELAD